ncbi:MAG: GNAT family N-acetyltransferase [Candidatus Zeuxoniibacter abyssi]|nr:MAG: GNAT family N-acetyltransferase [Candidatus Persebacteraceae bacterium AB1(2)]
MNISRARGLTVSFRFVEVDDAEYILSLRLNPESNRYISPTVPSVEKQREWLASYKEQELVEMEYCYIITNNNDDTPCGVIQLYNFNNGIFEWGSLILDDNKTPSAAIEAAFFIYSVAFDLLGFDKSHFTVHKENVRTVIFQKRLGARIIGEQQTQIGAEHLFEFDKNDWLLAQQKFKKFMPAPYEATTRRAFQKHRQ